MAVSRRNRAIPVPRYTSGVRPLPLMTTSWVFRSVMNPAGWAAKDGALADYRARLLDTVFQHSPIGKALVSTDGQFMAVNPAFCRLIGYSAKELLGLTFQQITFPDDLAVDLALLTELSAGQRDHYRMVKRYLAPGGAPGVGATGRGRWLRSPDCP